MLRWAGMLSVALFLVALGGYLMTMNALATQGYALKELETKISDLTRQHKQLHIQQAQLTSLYRIRHESDIAGLISSEEHEVVYALHHFALRE